MLDSLAFASLSDQLMTATIVVYSLAMLRYAAEFAYGCGAVREREAVTASAVVGAPALVGVGPPAAGGEDAGAPSMAGRGGMRLPDRIGRLAVWLTPAGWALHLGEIATRGVAAGRLPWGNMYEFVSALAFAAVTFFLLMLVLAGHPRGRGDHRVG